MATSNKKEKRLARERQALTGEPYTVALTHVRQKRLDVSDKTNPDISDALWNQLSEDSKRRLAFPVDLEHLEPGDLGDILDVWSEEPAELEDCKLPHYLHYELDNTYFQTSFREAKDFQTSFREAKVDLEFMSIGAAVLNPGEERAMLAPFYNELGTARVVQVLLEGTVPVEVLSVHVLKKVDSVERWPALENDMFESSVRWKKYLSLGAPGDEGVLSSNSYDPNRSVKFKLEIRYPEPVSIDLSDEHEEWKVCVRVKNRLAEPGFEEQGVVSGLIAYSLDMEQFGFKS